MAGRGRERVGGVPRRTDSVAVNRNPCHKLIDLFALDSYSNRTVWSRVDGRDVRVIKAQLGGEAQWTAADSVSQPQPSLVPVLSDTREAPPWPNRKVG